MIEITKETHRWISAKGHRVMADCINLPTPVQGTLTLILGGLARRPTTFVTRTLEPPKTKQCAFVTFPKYVWDTRCYAYRSYTTFQKSNMATHKPEVSKPFVVVCGSHHIS